MQISEVTVERVRELFIEHGDRLDVEVCLNDLGSILYGSRILKKMGTEDRHSFLEPAPKRDGRLPSRIAALLGAREGARSSPAVRC